MQIIKNRQIINNPWQLEIDNPGQRLAICDDSKPRLVALNTWLRIRHNLKDCNEGIGIYLNPDDEVSSIANDLGLLPLVALIFNGITEGRGYSQAAELREQYHYRGEIRAIGAFLDNLALMERCGINAFQMACDEELNLALSFFTEIETVYPYN